MLSRLTRTTARTTARRPARPLALEALESREVPAVAVRIDYSFDAAGFFNAPARRAILQQAAGDIARHITSSLAAITPSGGNYWTATFFNPATGQQVKVANPAVPADTIIIYAGDGAGAGAGAGGGGGYSGDGTAAWKTILATRGTAGYSLWGGSVAFDTTRDWYFGTSQAGLGRQQIDFNSVASHELGHVLGSGTARQWFAQVGGGVFTGAYAESAYGGPVPVSANRDHRGDGLTTGGERGAMDPVLRYGARDGFSALDFAALRDIGWSVDESAATATLPAVQSAAPAASVPTTGLVTLTGVADGSAQGFNLGADGTLTAAGSRFQPFPGWGGVIRSVVADFDGDGYADVLYRTGDTGGPRVRAVGGAVLSANPGQDAYYLPALADFFALDPADRSGLRLAAHDLTGDGKAGLVVASGSKTNAQVRVLTLADMQNPAGPTAPVSHPITGPTADGVYLG